MVQILSQEEINALLQESDDPTVQLTPKQKKGLGEIGLNYGVFASNALSELVKKRVVIDTPTVFSTTQQELKEQHPTPYVIIEVTYKSGLIGSNVLIIKTQDASIIANLMMGGDGLTPKELLDQMELSALGEAMNQMVGSGTTALSTLLSVRLDVEPPKVRLADLTNAGNIVKDLNADQQVVVISFKLQIDGLADSEIMMLIPYEFAIKLADSFVLETETGTGKAIPEAATVEQPPVEYAAAPAPPPREIPVAPARTLEVNQFSEPSGYNAPPIIPSARPRNNFSSEVQSQIMVQPAQFAPIGMTKNNKEPSNIGLILDVPLQVTVELGSTRMKIKDILELGLGSVVELDKLAGDPVDIYVNGKMIAKGEVVVIDENFGIKVTDIISPIERANTLQ